jgi:lipopolysaccharide/colanic/teichoic acid biosynthesis glycosyltransferase
MYSSIVKRLLDLVLSTSMLIALAPLMLLIALTIRLTSRGPAILLQSRIGKDGRPFGMMKYRSMYLQPNDERAALAEKLKQRGILLKAARDNRVTSIGWVLRKLSLDELPQLINILKGEMSLVGPRPLLQFMVAHYPYESALRAQVRPGLTGLWQVSARSECTSLMQMIDYDMCYVENLTWKMDLAIIARTIPVVLSTRGAK